MIRLQSAPPRTVDDAIALLQQAVGIEFGTLPAYLYTLFSIPAGSNLPAAARLKAIAMQEMTHMCLVCNIINALGGEPVITAPTYPGPLPGDIGDGGPPLVVHLLPFGREAMQQGMDIEQPDIEIPIPDGKLLAGAQTSISIGQFYQQLDAFLFTLPDSAWTKDRNQINDAQYFAGELFAVNNYADANRAIQHIVSQGEGSEQGGKASPLDFQHEVSHFYRFEEVHRNQVLTKANNEVGYVWGEPLGVDWDAVYPAIPDPGEHDFSQDSPAAQAAQDACDLAFTTLVQDLQQAVNGEAGRLGHSVRAMFDLRMAADVAVKTPLADGVHVAGPAFLYRPNLIPGTQS